MWQCPLVTARHRALIRRRWLPLAIGAITFIALVVFVVVQASLPDWGTRADRIASPTGEFEVVQYEWAAMIDPGWNLAIERVDTGEREWFWRSTEHPAPTSIRFTGTHSIEVTDADGQVYRVDFDSGSLVPSDRYCLDPGYCSDAPWNDYTRTSS